MPTILPPTFTLRAGRLDRSTYELAASQVLRLPPEQAFRFFEAPQNLFDITPDWLRFVMRDGEAKTETFEGAEFDYTIRWFGIPISWRSRITGYRPPYQFTDVQLDGPYRTWIHRHAFDEADGGTLMRDIVTYQLPLGPIGRTVHRLAVRRQLEDIFRYRAVRIDEWARGRLQRKKR